MKILIWISVAGLQALILKFDLMNCALGLAEWVHTGARHLLESHPSPWNWFYEAILIGSDEGLRSQPALQSFFVLGLYHLIVVSGSHVLAFEKIIHVTFFFLPVRTKRIITFVGLILFCFVNRLQASCVRAFASWIVSNKKPSRPVLNGDIQMIVTALCLVFEPSWARSLSFQLSCGATLGLALAASFQPTGILKRKLCSTFFCSAITAPLVFSFQPCLSWLVVPANTLAMPLFEGVLMPLSVFNVLIRPLSFLTEKIFALVFGFSDYLAQFEKPLLCLDQRRLSQWGIIYLCAVYLVWRLCLPWFFRQLFWQSQERDEGTLTPESSTGT